MNISKLKKGMKRIKLRIYLNWRREWRDENLKYILTEGRNEEKKSKNISKLKKGMKRRIFLNWRREWREEN